MGETDVGIGREVEAFTRTFHTSACMALELIQMTTRGGRRGSEERKLAYQVIGKDGKLRK